MIAGARYGHTNLIARDWRALSAFYQQQFGCTPPCVSLMKSSRRALKDLKSGDRGAGEYQEKL